MKIFAAIVLVLCTTSANVSTARAECYGEAATAYGCGVPANTGVNMAGRSAPSLEAFGSTEAPVLPDTGYYNQPQGSTDVITPEEQHRMMRNIVLGKGGSNPARSAQMRAVNSAAQPIRRSGSFPARIR